MTVLVGVDGSEVARTALRWAWWYASTAGKGLTAVQAWQIPFAAALPGGPRAPQPDEGDAATAAELEATLRAEIDRAGEVVPLVERGPAPEAILRAAARIHAELVVVGRRGLGVVAGAVMGSVSRRVLEQADVPVAVVSRVADDRGGPVVVGVDRSDNAAAATRWAARAAHALGRELVVVHAASLAPFEPATPGTAEAERQGLELANEHARSALDLGVEVRTTVPVGDPRAQIEEVAEAEHACMVVVGARGAGPLTSLLIGSTSSYLVEHTEHPLVLVPDPSRAAQTS